MLCSLFFIIDIIFENDLYAFEFSEIALRQFLFPRLFYKTSFN